MDRVVLDTNILVSALLNPNGPPAAVLDHILNGGAALCYDSRILLEYEQVLLRPKFGFSPKDVHDLIGIIRQIGLSVLPVPRQIDMSDESDRKFLDVATSCQATLVTGNQKHFPEAAFILSAKTFLGRLGNRSVLADEGKGCM